MFINFFYKLNFTLNIHRSPWTVKRETSFALTKHDFTLFDCLKWFDPVSVELMFTLIFPN